MTHRGEGRRASSYFISYNITPFSAPDLSYIHSFISILSLPSFSSTMATAASSYYSEDGAGGVGSPHHDADGAAAGASRGATPGAGLASGGSSVVYEPENEHEEHHIRRG